MFFVIHINIHIHVVKYASYNYENHFLEGTLKEEKYLISTWTYKEYKNEIPFIYFRKQNPS